MVFGPLADTEVIGFSFAINVLPIIIFFSALMSVLYHLRVMEWIVKIVGGALHKIIGTGAVESMNAAANVFVGQTEAPLAVKPYLKGLTEPQMFAVMVSGLASIAGTVLAGYALMGAELKYLLAAAFMAAPGGLLMAKIIIPDDEKVSSSQHESLEMERSQHKNVILAAASGTTDGLRLAANIGAMLIAFVALIAMVNGLVGWVAGWFGYDMTLQSILGWIFSPLMYLLSVPWEEAQAAGALFGEKLILKPGRNESAHDCGCDVFSLWLRQPVIDSHTPGRSWSPRTRETRSDRTTRYEGRAGGIFIQSHECGARWITADFLRRGTAPNNYRSKTWHRAQ